MAAGPHAEPDLRALGDRVLAAADRHALQALRLVEQVGELGPRPLERRRVHVGDVVGDDLEIGLLGIHPGRRNG